MPETPHHSFEFHLSTTDDIRGSWTHEIHQFCDTHLLWFAFKHEKGENGKLHLHLAAVREICDSTTNGGAMTASNFKRFLISKCPTLKSYLAEKGSPHSIVCPPMKSDQFIAEYMQKEGSLKYFKIPRDLFELQPYFADMQAKKAVNPEYDHWEKSYLKEKRPMPVTYDSSFHFMYDHMYLERDMKIVLEPRKLKYRVQHFVQYVNRDAYVAPKLTAPSQGIELDRTNPNSEYHFRTCPRCIAKDVDAPNLLMPKEQFCSGCKKYDPIKSNYSLHNQELHAWAPISMYT